MIAAKNKIREGKEFIDFERKFVMALSLIAGIMALVGTIINISLGFPLILYLIPFVGALLYAYTYYLAWKSRKILLAKWLVTILSLIIVNSLWFFNYGSDGPAPYFFVVLYSILIFTWSGRTLVYITIAMGLNLLGIFLLDLYVPGLTGEYESELTRLIDTYTGILIYIAIIFVILRLSKHAYIKAYREARQADMLKSAFLANMSHEIRTPLNAILGFSEMMTKRNLTSTQKHEFHKIIKENNDQLLQVINDILDVSKIEAGELELNPAVHEITEILENLKHTFDQFLENQNKPEVTLSFEYPGQKIYLETDKARLRQVLSNLLSNAIKFTHKGKVELKCEVQEDSLEFSVSDTGIGISKSDQENIFKRFYKVSDTSNDEVYSGTGIGLFITKHLVQLLGGELTVSSEEGKGSIFSFSLPKKNFHTERPAPEHSRQEDTRSDLSAIKVIVAEDDKFNQHFFKQILNSFGIDPIQVCDGNKVMDAIREHPDTDIILMDLKMPDLAGTTAMKKIRKFNSSVYIIAQTAHAMAEDEAKSMKEGFDDYISKPIDTEILKRKLLKGINKKRKNK
ncbi:MAG: ATP-binding protein [Bacteroidales bacterium]